MLSLDLRQSLATLKARLAVRDLSLGLAAGDFDLDLDIACEVLLTLQGPDYFFNFNFLEYCYPYKLFSIYIYVAAVHCQYGH